MSENEHEKMFFWQTALFEAVNGILVHHKTTVDVTVGLRTRMYQKLNVGVAVGKSTNSTVLPGSCPCQRTMACFTACKADCIYIFSHAKWVIQRIFRSLKMVFFRMRFSTSFSLFHFIRFFVSLRFFSSCFFFAGLSHFRTPCSPPFLYSTMSRGILVSLLVLAVLLPLVCGGKITGKHSSKSGKNHGKEETTRRSSVYDGRAEVERTGKVMAMFRGVLFLGSPTRSLY